MSVRRCVLTGRCALPQQCLLRRLGRHCLQQQSRRRPQQKGRHRLQRRRHTRRAVIGCQAYTPATTTSCGLPVILIQRPRMSLARPRLGRPPTTAEQHCGSAYRRTRWALRQRARSQWQRPSVRSSFTTGSKRSRASARSRGEKKQPPRSRPPSAGGCASLLRHQMQCSPALMMGPGLSGVHSMSAEVPTSPRRSSARFCDTGTAQTSSTPCQTQRRLSRSGMVSLLEAAIHLHSDGLCTRSGAKLTRLTCSRQKTSQSHRQSPRTQTTTRTLCRPLARTTTDTGTRCIRPRPGPGLS